MKTDLQQLITSLASKYDIPSILTRIEEIATTPTAKIGLIGPFSAGKTSLLNAMIGSKLPVALDPTTKSVCLVEFRKAIEKPLYWLDDGDERKQVSFMEFDDLIAGNNAEKQIVGVAQFPETGDFHEDVVFVDTPGVDSLGREEADVTYSYLAFLDAAIVCLPVTDGTVQQSVVDFLADPRMALIAKHLIFVLTKCDLKPAEAVKTVKAEVVRQLEELTEKGTLALGSHVDERVFTFSTEQDSSALVAFLREHLLQEVPRLARERQTLRYKDIAHDLADILNDQQNQMRYDSTQLDAEKRRIEKELAALEEEERRRRATFTALEDKLADELVTVMMAHEAAITAIPVPVTTPGPDGEPVEVPGTDSRREAIQAMLKDIQQTATDFAQRHVKDFRPGSGFCGNLDARLTNMLSTVERVRDITVQVATSALLAAACPAAGVAGNAAEAGGALAAQKIAKKAAQTATTVTKGETFRRLLGGIGKIIKDINPMEPIGDLIAARTKDGKFETFARQTSRRIAGNLVESLDKPYQEQVIRPVAEKIQEAERAIDALRSQDAQALEDFRTKRKTLKADIDALKDAANA